MTIYQRELKERIASHYADMSSDQLIDLLFDMGVVDHTRCKVLAVREKLLVHLPVADDVLVLLLA